jgi:hypothetical protein
MEAAMVLRGWGAGSASSRAGVVAHEVAGELPDCNTSET